MSSFIRCLLFSGKMATMLWYIFSMMMILIYHCNLRANLLAPRYEKKLNTIEDLVESGRKIVAPIISKSVLL